jgi:hypothetical protein
MSNDLLPLPDILTGSLGDSNASGAVGENAAVDRDRGALTEYKPGAPQSDIPDTRTLLRTIVRLEAAMRNGSAQMPADMLRGLSDLAAAIKQIESVLRANEAPSVDVHFAVENIHDIAMALRQREVEAALCDTLDAAIREVGDAIVRGDAAAARAQSVAASLRELARRMDDMIALAASNDAGRYAEEIGDSEAATERFADTADPPVAHHALIADAAVAGPHETKAASDVPRPRDARLPDKEAAIDVGGYPGDLFAPVPSSAPSSVAAADRFATVVVSPRPHETAEASASNSTSPDASVPGIKANTLAAAALPDPAVDFESRTPKASHAATNDPLAALNALSEEELIALFS